jgi:hypothetical protein
MFRKRPGPVILFLLLLNMYSSRAQAQFNKEFNIWPAQPGDTLRVLLRTANVRTEPDVAAAIVDSLICGTPVTVGAQSGFDQFRGIRSPWIKVKYNIAGLVREGYMWLGTLTLGHCVNAEGTCFLYGIDQIQSSADAEGNSSRTWHIAIKVLDSRLQLLKERRKLLKDPEISMSACKLLGDMGLQNLKDIFRIYFSGEACGIPTEYYYYGWNGQELSDLPGKTEVGDAGVYYHTETLLFPEEQGGKPGRIIRLTVEGENEDEKVDKNGDPVFKEKRSKEVYIWDGKTAKKQ